MFQKRCTHNSINVSAKLKTLFGDLKLQLSKTKTFTKSREKKIKCLALIEIKKNNDTIFRWYLVRVLIDINIIHIRIYEFSLNKWEFCNQ